MSSILPKEYINLAALGINVANKWAQNHPNYKINFTNYQDLGILAEKLKDASIVNSNEDSVKKDNTLELSKINKEINEAVKVLRNYIKGEHPEETDFKRYYISHGLETNKARSYILPADNDRRQQRLIILVKELSNSRAGYVNSRFGLQFWADAQAKHAKSWEHSKAIKSNKSGLSQQTKSLFAQLYSILQRLQTQIRLDFDKKEQPAVYRTFGFLNEVYN